MTLSDLRQLLEHISGDNDGEIRVYVEWSDKKNGSLVYDVDVVRLELDCDDGMPPTLIIVPDQRN